MVALSTSGALAHDLVNISVEIDGWTMLPIAAFGKGFFVADPLYAIANHIEDPEPLAEGAEDAGLAAGSGSINTGGVSGGGSYGGGSDAGGGQSADGCGCDNACLQTMIALGADVYLIESPATLEEADQALADADLVMDEYVSALFPCCRKRTVTNSFDLGAWACGPWTLTSGPVPTGPGAGSLFNCNYSRTATRTQTRTRIRTCRNCVRCTWRQTRTQTSAPQRVRSTITVFPPAVPTCPGVPVTVPGCAGLSVASSTAWTPGPTCCP